MPRLREVGCHPHERVLWVPKAVPAMHMRVAPMSDTGQEPYTPSDAMVRECYTYRYLPVDKDEAPAVFARWLAAHDAEVTRAAAEKALRAVATEIWLLSVQGPESEFAVQRLRNYADAYKALGD